MSTEQPLTIEHVINALKNGTHIAYGGMLLTRIAYKADNQYVLNTTMHDRDTGQTTDDQKIINETELRRQLDYALGNNMEARSIRNCLER